MKAVTIVVQVLLGLMFVVFGLNYFLQFLPMPQQPAESLPAKFFAVMGGSGYMAVVAVLQIVGGLLLLSYYLVPLGLTVLGPIVVNILLYHIFIDHSGIQLAIVVAVVEIFLIWRYWPHFAPIFAVKPTALK